MVCSCVCRQLLTRLLALNAQVRTSFTGFRSKVLGEPQVLQVFLRPAAVQYVHLATQSTTTTQLTVADLVFRGEQAIGRLVEVRLRARLSSHATPRRG